MFKVLVCSSSFQSLNQPTLMRLTLTLTHASTPDVADWINAVVVIPIHKTQLNLEEKREVGRRKMDFKKLRFVVITTLIWLIGSLDGVMMGNTIRKVELR